MSVVTETDTRKKIIRNYINIAIIFGVMIAFHFIPAPAPITTMGMQVIGIFIGMIYGWMTCGMLWPSLAGILMLLCHISQT
jgi:solute carrier family 13 (sodium-dependent dicarboxylate transporter), member 2/3/5